MVDTSEMKALSQYLDGCFKNLHDSLSQGAFIAGKKMQESAREYVPVDTGELKTSIEEKLFETSNTIKVKISPNKPYASGVEYGQPPGTQVSAASLAGWASRKGLNPYAVAAGIRKRGTRPHPFMKPAFDDTAPDVVEIIIQSIVNIFK